MFSGLPEGRQLPFLTFNETGRPLLSSIEDGELTFWASLIDRYRRLLDLQGFGFDVTRLAARQLEILACVTEKSADGDDFSRDDIWGLPDDQFLDFVS